MSAAGPGGGGAAAHHGADPGLVTAAGVCLAVLAALILRLENPWWAAISAWMVANPDVQALWLKGLMRIAGTVLGCIIGYVAAIAAIDNIGLQAALLFLFGYGLVNLRYRMRYSYAWLFFMLMPVLLLYVAMQAPDTVRAFAIWRTLEIVTGVLAMALTAGLFTTFFGSAHARKSLRDAYLREKPKLTPRELRDIHILAVGGGGMTVLIALLWSIYDLPALTQIGITLLAVLDRDPVGTRIRGWQRIAGTVLGGLLGLAVIAAGIDLLPIWLLLLFLGLFLFAGLHHFGGGSAYIGTQGGIAYMFCLVSGAGPPETFMPVVNRLAGMMSGIFLLLVVLILVEAVTARLDARRPPAGGTEAGPDAQPQ